MLTDLFIIRGFPEYIRSDNGPEFVAKSVRDWISVVGVKKLLISNLAIRGKTDFAKALMHDLETYS